MKRETSVKSLIVRVIEDKQTESYETQNGGELFKFK